MPIRTPAFHERSQMPDSDVKTTESRITGLVQRLLSEHSIHRTVNPSDDLRDAGLSSLDMVSLVLSVEDEFELMIPEASILPANFRSIETVSLLVDSLRATG